MPRAHRPRIKGCFECSQRRISCDRGDPCGKCLVKGLRCSGLGLRLRFNDGIAARGKWVGQSMQSAYSEISKSSTTTCGSPELLQPTAKRPVGKVLFNSCNTRNSTSQPTTLSVSLATRLPLLLPVEDSTPLWRQQLLLHCKKAWLVFHRQS